MNGDELIDRLRLIRSENVGPITFFTLLRRFGTASRALEALPDLARRGGRTSAPHVPSRGDAARELDVARKLGSRLVAWDEPDYPAALKAIDGAPPLFYLRGNAALLGRRAVAVVGARNASASGVRFARRLAAELAQANLLVVSGLARGIDGAAHQGALDAGATSGGTLAVLAGGVDQPYPPEHQPLYEKILSSGAGAALSEQPPGLVAQARDFPKRNRLIAGLSLGVVVVEAAFRSGSLITARLANEQGREVFAVPGSPLDPRCRGANDLIRQGAALTESAADVLAALGGAAERRPQTARDAQAIESERESFAAPDENMQAQARERVLGALGPTPVEVDEIVRQCQLSAPIVQAALLELELAGRLARHSGNRVALDAN
ncbi:MAG: DNA-processing protein DprA [Rhodospirillales bacterium]